MYKGDIIRDIYFRQDRPGVAIIAEAESVEVAKAALAEFPLAKAGLIDWEVIPLGPFANWQALFAAMCRYGGTVPEDMVSRRL